MQPQQNNNNNIVAHNSSIDAYIRHGWKVIPIPPNTKGPDYKDWNKEGNHLKDATKLPDGWGVGLAHAYSGTCAIDIDNWDVAKNELAARGIDLDELYNATDAVTIHSREGRGKLIYKMPIFGVTLPTKKLTFKKDGLSQVYLELRCASKNGTTVQDVLPPTIHPVTQQPYQWSGKGKWKDLPVIPNEILDYWTELAEEDNKRVIPMGDESIDCSWNEVESALNGINPDVDRETWIEVAMALHDTGTKLDKLDQALQLFNTWSSQGKKYKGEYDIARVWNSFTANDGITIGTLFKHAMDAGWRRPLPDVSELFGDISEKKFRGPLEILQSPAPQVNFDLAPDILAIRSEEVGEAIGADPIIPLFAGMATVCGAVDARMRLRLAEGFLVPPLLWFMTIGEPADKKTPSVSEMMDILEEIEEESLKDYSTEVKYWQQKEKKYKKDLAAWEDLMDENDGEPQPSNEVTGLPPEDVPPKPESLRLKVSDITSQKLVTMCENRPYGMVCHLDEMSGWMEQVTGKGTTDNRSTWTKSYECKSERFDRVGSGEKKIKHFAISMYGNVQPDVFRSHAKALSTDGLLQRFIPAIAVDPCTVFQDIPRELTHKDAYEDLIRQIHKLPVKTYELSHEAYEIYEEYKIWYNKTKAEEKMIKAAQNKAFMGAFGKTEGLVGRIALVWHLLENPTGNELSADLLRRAIRFVKEFIIPSFRYVYGEVGGLQMGGIESWLADYVVQNSDKDFIKLSEIKVSAKRQLENLNIRNTLEKNNVIRDGMITLEIHKWVMMVEENGRTIVWAINPRIREMFKEYRQEVIRIKQKRLDEIKRITDANRAKKGLPAVERKFTRGYDPETMDEKDENNS